MVSRRWLLPLLVVGFILISVAEVWLLTAVGTHIGLGWTLAILIAEALVGAWLMQREGSKAWNALWQAISLGRMPSGQLADAALILVGGILLILPGFFTDVIGLAFLLPATRPLVRRGLGLLIARSASHAGIDLSGRSGTFAAGTVVPGETVPDEDPAASQDRKEPPAIKGEREV